MYGIAAVRAYGAHLGLPRLIRTSVTPGGSASSAAGQHHVNRRAAGAGGRAMSICATAASAGGRSGRRPPIAKSTASACEQCATYAGQLHAAPSDVTVAR
jgi:hypothetical protein